MSGFWQNMGNNNRMFLNSTLPTLTGDQFNPPLVTTAPALDFNTARAILAASIPPHQGTFLPKSQQGQAGVTKTKSVITLPPSLSRARRGVDKADSNLLDNSALGSEANIVSQSATSSNVSNNSRLRNNYAVDNISSGASPVNFPSNTSTPQLPNFDILSVKNDIQPPEDTSTPVFSTEISKGKEFPSSSKQDQPIQSIVLDASNTYNKSLPPGSLRVLHDNNYWHKFIITGAVSQNKVKILKRILDASEPMLLVPVMYQEEGETAVFYSRNCGSAIEKLCRMNNLLFELDGTKFFLQIQLQCAPIGRLRINLLSYIRKALEKRYNSAERCLDLSNFEHDPDLSPYMFCPLSQPSVLHHVLSTAIMYPINFYVLRLCHNGIRQLKIEILFKASYLRTLDLSHNELLYEKDLKDLRELNQVTKLILDGNPLCAEYRTPEEYISKLKSLMPQLKSLDSVSLYSGAISVPKEKNFLCSKSGHQMVDQFLKHFFNRYDWTDRRCLDGLYHNNALFSLTCTFISGQSTSDSASLTWYTSYNRNLVKMSDYTKAEKFLYYGPDEILELFSSLPATEHDPYSFCVDLVHYNDKAAVISVAGVFREHPTLPPEPAHMRSFRRVFSLCCTAPHEWQIINEQLHVSNLTTEQVDASFKYKRPPIEPPVAAWLVQDAQLLSDTEKDQMSSIMMQLTTLNKEWATKFLKDCHWYVREALISFVNQYEAKVLPDEAFSNQN